jgi:hypothetical protein
VLDTRHVLPLGAEEQAHHRNHGGDPKVACWEEASLLGMRVALQHGTC